MTYKIIFLSVFIFPLTVISQQQRRFVAEWEPAWGTLIRWPLGIPSELVVELAEDDSLYVMVESNYQRDQALDAFNAWNVNINHCRFLYAPTYSHWTRDWGPHYIFNEQGIAGIADPIFNGYPWVPGCPPSGYKPEHSNSIRAGILGWEEDDAVNIALADSFNCPLIALPVYLTGGNIMVDGYQTAISTQQMLDENFPIANEEVFRQMAEDSLGISNYIIVNNPEVHGIQHIDCYAKFLDEETILVKQVDTWNPEYECCEALAEHLGNELSCFGNPFNIIRIYCGAYNGTEVAAYTNSLILNKKVLVPTFNIASDESALQTYADAMPGYEVIGFDWEGWYYYDALHCRTMGIFDRKMLRIGHKPLEGEISFSGLPFIKALIDDRSDAGLVEDDLLLHWREQGTTFWYTVEFYPMEYPDSFYSFIPYPVIGTTYEYYIAAADSSGRNETMPRTAPEKLFSFTVSDLTTQENEYSNLSEFSVQPTIFTEGVEITFPGVKEANLCIWSMNGQLVRKWHYNQIGKAGKIHWDGKSMTGEDCSEGMYLVAFIEKNGVQVKKIVRK
ncbi:MAG: agmatine deiminase family protein [Bacteroidales bacterium]|nr:agmatine deiminase family protein [Bacteroidales bacterium]